MVGSGWRKYCCIFWSHGFHARAEPLAPDRRDGRFGGFRCMFNLCIVLTVYLQFKIRLTVTMVLDMVGCWIIEKVCKYLFADLEPKPMITRGRERREKRRLEEAAAKGGVDKSQ